MSSGNQGNMPEGASLPDAEGVSAPPPVPPPAPATRGEKLARWWRRNSTNALIVGVVTALLGGAVPVVTSGLWDEIFPPKKEKCPKDTSSCDGRSPKTHGCGVDAKTYVGERDNPVRLQLRYSKRCSAVWGRIVRGEVGDAVTVAVSGGHAEEAVIASNHDVFTKMAVVNQEDFHVRVCAVPSTGAKSVGTWKKYCFPADEDTIWK